MVTYQLSILILIYNVLIVAQQIDEYRYKFDNNNNNRHRYGQKKPHILASPQETRLPPVIQPTDYFIRIQPYFPAPGITFSNGNLSTNI
jgi:hypothetical protein